MVPRGAGSHTPFQPLSARRVPATAAKTKPFGGGGRSTVGATSKTKLTPTPRAGAVAPSRGSGVARGVAYSASSTSSASSNLSQAAAVIDAVHKSLSGAHAAVTGAGTADADGEGDLFNDDMFAQLAGGEPVAALAPRVAAPGRGPRIMTHAAAP
jgi:hypothetical protein